VAQETGSDQRDSEDLEKTEEHDTGDLRKQSEETTQDLEANPVRKRLDSSTWITSW
jgi:hypothetical protein